ncbi:MAG: macro domain-containing protein [Bacteroidales bacterium]|nr:macro domain-containing protein [Bacteroidales bacterium]
MIKYIEGNIFDSNAQALVNTVNLVGVMGKGIALQFKKKYPENYVLYKKACSNKTIDIGKLFVTKATDLNGEKLIINFPTKIDWRKSSEYSYIEEGLTDLITIIRTYKINSIALPPLGSGNGGLDWNKTNNYKQIIKFK